MPTPYVDRVIDPPLMLPGDEPFWQGAREGKLLLKRCEACGEIHYFPRAICPLCGSDRTSWRAARGRGRVYSLTVARRGVPSPIAVALVTLDEGVTMLTNIVDCDLDSVRIGDDVEVVFKPCSDGTPVPMFRPAKAG